MEAKQRQHGEGPDPDERARERMLLAAMRRADEAAILAFHERYEFRLMDISRSLRVARSEREGTVLEFLSVIAESLRASQVVPRSLTAYVTAAFSNFVKEKRRSELLRREREGDACTEVGDTGESAALGSCSEYSARAAAGMDAPLPGCVPARINFARAILDSLSSADRELFEYQLKLSLRESAELAGMSYNNAKVRMFRIRAHALKTARKLARTMPDNERAELATFLLRTGLVAQEEDAKE